jgi:hypothetical protein
MKTLFFSVIFFLINTSVSAQFLRLGVEGNFLTGNKYYSYQFGPALLAEYSFENLPISITGSVRVHISELNDEYLAGYNNNIIGYGLSVNYYPIYWVIEPYIGVGVFYNSNTLEPGGMPNLINGVINADNNIAAELIGGIKFASRTPINFFIEITQTFSKSAQLVTAEELSNVIIERKDIKLFNSLFLSIGLLFKI